MRFRIRRLLGKDRASFLVVGAITLAAFAFLGGALLEVGQWYQHRRNLQVRTDAAALAGGTLFNECFADLPSANADMETAAANYSGIPGKVQILGGGQAGSSYNQAWQAGSSTDDAIGFQSNEYPTPGPSPETTLPARDAFGANSNECDTLELDVKQTQNLPNLLSISPFSKVHGWARVELQTVLAEKPSLPFAIPNFDLSEVGVTFFDEATGNELTGCTGALAGTTCTYQLTNTTPPGGATGQDGESVTQWSLSPVSINLPTPSSSNGDLIGVRVSTGSNIGSCAPSFGTGTNAYACVDITQTGSGLVGIRDYPTTNQTPVPLWEVWPSDSCSSDTSPYFSDLTGKSSCTVTLQAYVGETANCAATPPNNATLSATLPAGFSITLTRTSTCTTSHGGGAWLWSGSTILPIDSNSTQSEYPITSLDYKAGGTKQSWTNVQRFTSGNLDDDGPVRMISLSGAGNPYSATAGPDTVGVTVVTSQEGISKQLIVLRGAHNGSSTAFILCYDGGSGSPYKPEQGDPGIQDGMQNGCSFSYGINPTLTCPDPGGAQPLPADCVPNKASASGGNPTVTKPLNARFGCSNNPPTYPDNWPNFSVPGDKRAVTLILTSYNAYANGGKQNGSQTYPVAGFGNFYIAGFSGDKCTGDPPPPPEAAADGNNSGDVWGYFIQYATGGAVPSGKKCKLNTFGSCVPALVR